MAPVSERLRKRARSRSSNARLPPAKKLKVASRPAPVEEAARLQRLQHPKEPVGQPWPLRQLLAFDAPGALEPYEVGWGKLLPDVLKARGWRFSTDPVRHIEDGPGGRTVYMREFEACLRRQAPAKAFGKKGSVQEGHSLRKLPLPSHALWMMGYSAYRIPGTANGRVICRDDFAKTVVNHGSELPGKPGNYRICKFPGMETALFKTNLAEAFREKSWWPRAYVLPKERDAFLKVLRAGGRSRSNLWIAKPRNEHAGAGIRAWEGSDKKLIKMVRESEGQPRSLVQSYIADPFLVGGYKFHMRIHLVITSLSPLQAFVQENGQCLFATMPYSLASKTLGMSFVPPMHVTNMGLNATPENKDNYFKAKPVIGKGQQLRMKELMAHLKKAHPSYDKADLWQQITNISAETARYIAQAPSVRKSGKFVPDRHFEIFGMDLMLDKNLKVWMCEVNGDPGLDYPDDEILGSPNPDYKKEAEACSQTFHDLFTLLGLDAGRPQPKGSLKSWYKLDFPEQS